MYQRIINEIKSNLGDNKDLNRKYLLSEIEKYKTHEYNKEIIREISRMLWDCLSDLEKEEYIEITEAENPIIDILEEISSDIQMNELEKALDKMDSFMETFIPMYEDDEISEYHSFTNPLEEVLFDTYVDAKKEPRYIPDSQPYTDLYYIYGYLLVENNRLDEAEENLKHALKINPVSARIILELSEIYKIKTPTFNKFFMYTTQALTYAYYPADIARCYRNLGHYYIEEDQLDVAEALFKYSLTWELSPMAYSELQYIKTKNGDILLTDDECIEIIKKKNIPVEPNPFILKTLDELARDYEDKYYLNQSLYFYRIIYNLKKDEKTLMKIQEIENKI
ncbi:MAG: hypothetical protein IKE95_00505 [Methanobrevibacter sp.]|nr:hypothetical protein [Methanobrevibacter sp.]